MAPLSWLNSEFSEICLSITQCLYSWERFEQRDYICFCLWAVMNMNTQFNKPNNISLIAQTLFFKSYLFLFFPHRQFSPLCPHPPPPSFPKLQKGHLNACTRMWVEIPGALSTVSESRPHPGCNPS